MLAANRFTRLPRVSLGSVEARSASPGLGMFRPAMANQTGWRVGCEVAHNRCTNAAAGQTGWAIVIEVTRDGCATAVPTESGSVHLVAGNTELVGR